MMNIKRIATISMCSVLVSASIPVYAESTGSIEVSSNIENEEFKGEIYVILSDNTGKQKLVLLNQANNYQYKIDDLQYANYEVKEVHVYNTDDEYDKNRKDMKADYTIESGNLNLSEENQNPSITVNLHSATISDKGEGDTNKVDSNDNIEITKEDENKNEDTKLTENNSSNTEQNKSLGIRKKYFFFNFIIDAVLIIGLGSIWFFKIRGKKDEKNGK